MHFDLKRFASIAFVLAACGDSGTGGGGGQGGGGAQNQPPTWEGAPASIEAFEAVPLAVPFAPTDPDGDAVTVTLDAPVGMELAATDTELDLFPGIGVTGTSLDLSLADAEASTPVSIPLTIHPLEWLDREIFTSTMEPEAREHGAVLWDAAGGQAFLIGGSGYAPQGTPLGDVWRYVPGTTADGTWEQVVPLGDVPPPGGSRELAGAWGEGTALLFGGYGANFVNFDDLYRVEVEGQTLRFTLLTQVGTPPERSLHVFAYDPLIDKYFLFGGAGNAAPLGDTWMLEVSGDTGTWTDLDPTGGPSARYGSFYGMDEQNGRLVVFSGAQGFASINAADDTWALDTRAMPPTWILLTDGTEAGAPPGRRNGCAVLDPRAPLLWVFGGTSNGMTTEPGLWVLDARPASPTWHEMTDIDGMPPPLRSSGIGFFDGSRTYLGFGNDAGLYRDWGIIGHAP